MFSFSPLWARTIPPVASLASASWCIMVLGESHYCDEGCTDCGNVANHRECRTFTNGGGGRVKVMAVNHPWTVLFHQWRKKLGEEMTT